MATLDAPITGELFSSSPSISHSSKLKTFGFAVVIIMGIGALTAAGVGLSGFGVQQGWWQCRSLINLGGMKSIFLMTAGGSGGVVFLLIGIRGLTKNDNAKMVDSKPSEPGAILYMSISGNPAHLGHMAAMGTAIKELQQQQVKIDRAFVSLSSQAYVEEKQRRTLDKVCYTYQERIQKLLFVLGEAKKLNMFDSVSVEFWDDQEEGYSDHPISYEPIPLIY